MRATAIWSPAGAVTWDTAPEPVRHSAGGCAVRRARLRHAPTPSSAPMARCRWQRRPDRARQVLEKARLEPIARARPARRVACGSSIPTPP